MERAINNVLENRSNFIQKKFQGIFVVCGKGVTEAFWKSKKIGHDNYFGLCVSFHFHHVWANSDEKWSRSYINTEKMAFFQDFFSKNQIFGRISMSMALRPSYIERTISFDQFPCLMTTFNFFSKNLQPSEKSLKKVKNFQKNWSKFKNVKKSV